MADPGGVGVPLALVRYSDNFALILDSIEAFWTENDFEEGYDRLLDTLTDVVIPNLQRHPGMGALFAESTRRLCRDGDWLSA